MSAIQDLRETVARLRSPGGCPWDREQTHRSLCDCLVEECSELLDAIDRGDLPHMREELGDLLLHVVMHAQMAEEERHFDLEAVAAEINEKLIRRHPHVFGHMSLESSEEVLLVWDRIKAGEKVKRGPAREGLFKGLPPRLPALLFAREVFKQVEKGGFDVQGAYDRERVAARSQGLDEAAAGQALFEWVAACRLAGVDPESALRRFASEVVRGVNARAGES